MKNKHLYVISDRYLNVIAEKSKDIFEVEGCRDFPKATQELLSVDSCELKGVLIALSPNYPLEQLGGLNSVLYATEYLKTKVVIYCGSEKICKATDEILKDFSNSEIVLVSPAESFTEDFIKFNLFSIFIEGEVYNIGDSNRPEVEMSKILKRVKNTNDEEDMDSGIGMLKRLVEEATNTSVNIKVAIDDLLNAPEKVLIRDDVIHGIEDRLTDLKKRMSEEKKDSRVYKNSETELFILELLKDNRGNFIKTSNIKRYLEVLKSEFDEKISEITFDEVDLSEKEIEDLKSEKIKLEGEINGLMESSAKKLDAIKSIIDVKDFTKKLLLLQDKKKETEYTEIITSVVSMTRENISDFKVVNNLMEQTIKNWEVSLGTFRNKFAQYTRVRDKIEYKQESLITELKNSKNIKLVVNTTLASKLYLVCGASTNVGASLVTAGISSNYENPLILDMRYDNPHLGMYGNKDASFSLEEWYDKDVDSIVAEIKRDKLNRILPENVAFLLEDRVEFTQRILSVLEAVSSLYDIILINLDYKKEESKLLLSYGAVILTVCNTNMYTFYDTKVLIDSIKEYDNLKIKYLIFTPISDGFEARIESTRIGANLTSFRVKGIPFMPVDEFKNKGLNVFKERPLLKNKFKL